MAHAFLTVTMQVLHTPEPSKAIAWGPCSCWVYSTLSLHCHHLCHLLGWPRARFCVRQSLPKVDSEDSEPVCLICSGGTMPPLLGQVLCAHCQCPKASGQGHTHFSCVCRHLHPNSGAALSTGSVMKEIVSIEQKGCSQKEDAVISDCDNWEGPFGHMR